MRRCETFRLTKPNELGMARYIETEAVVATSDISWLVYGGSVERVCAYQCDSGLWLAEHDIRLHSFRGLRRVCAMLDVEDMEVCVVSIRLTHGILPDEVCYATMAAIYKAFDLEPDVSLGLIPDVALI